MSVSTELKGVPAHKIREAKRRERILYRWWRFEERHEGTPRGRLMKAFASAEGVTVKLIERCELRYRRGGGLAGLLDRRGRELTVRWRRPVQELLTAPERQQLAGLLRLVAERLHAVNTT